VKDQPLIALTASNLPFGNTTYITGLKLIANFIPHGHINGACPICNFNCSHWVTILRYSWFTWYHTIKATYKSLNIFPSWLVFINLVQNAYLYKWHSFISGTDHYEHVVPDVDINVQSGRFWATSIALFRERFTDFRSCWVVFIHIVRGHPGGLSSSLRGKLLRSGWHRIRLTFMQFDYHLIPTAYADTTDREIFAPGNKSSIYIELLLPGAKVLESESSITPSLPYLT